MSVYSTQCIKSSKYCFEFPFCLVSSRVLVSLPPTYLPCLGHLFNVFFSLDFHFFFFHPSQPVDSFIPLVLSSLDIPFTFPFFDPTFPAPAIFLSISCLSALQFVSFNLCIGPFPFFSLFARLCFFLFLPFFFTSLLFPFLPSHLPFLFIPSLKTHFPLYLLARTSLPPFLPSLFGFPVESAKEGQSFLRARSVCELTAVDLRVKNCEPGAGAGCFFVCPLSRVSPQACPQRMCLT